SPADSGLSLWSKWQASTVNPSSAPSSRRTRSVASESAPPERATSTFCTRRNIFSRSANRRTRSSTASVTGLTGEEPLPPGTALLVALLDRRAGDDKGGLSFAGIPELAAGLLFDVGVGG